MFLRELGGCPFPVFYPQGSIFFYFKGSLKNLINRFYSSIQYIYIGSSTNIGRRPETVHLPTQQNQLFLKGLAMLNINIKKGCKPMANGIICLHAYVTLNRVSVFTINLHFLHHYSIQFCTEMHCGLFSSAILRLEIIPAK